MSNKKKICVICVICGQYKKNCALRVICEKLMTRDEVWLSKYRELRTWVEEHHHYPPEHTLLHNWVRRNIKLRNKGGLPQWKCDCLAEVEAMRTHEHTGGRRKRTALSDGEGVLKFE